MLFTSSFGQRPARRGNADSKRSAFWVTVALEECVGLTFGTAEAQALTVREMFRGHEEDAEHTVSLSRREIAAMRTAIENKTMTFNGDWSAFVDRQRERLIKVLNASDPKAAYSAEFGLGYDLFFYNQVDRNTGQPTKSRKGRIVPLDGAKQGDTVAFIEFRPYTDSELTNAIAGLQSRESAIRGNTVEDAIDE